VGRKGEEEIADKKKPFTDVKGKRETSMHQPDIEGERSWRLTKSGMFALFGASPVETTLPRPQILYLLY
jgi:hypothetical protein|tara:strand:- start:266 stop:472 length:207 start_codon:yes stop_codon:yes gene_type:complete